MSPQKSHKVGIYGGSFDPPHRAHLQLIQQGIAQFELDAMWVLPTPWPSHRSGPQTDFDHRLRMAELAFGSIPSVKVSDLERSRPPPSYTVDTLKAVIEQNPHASLWLFIGADQAAVFDTWHQWETIMSLCRLVIWARPNAPAPAEPLTRWHNDHLMKLQFLNCEPMNLSSTQIRDQIRNSPRTQPDGVCDAVWHYLHTHHLYRI